MRDERKPAVRYCGNWRGRTEGVGNRSGFWEHKGRECEIR